MLTKFDFTRAKLDALTAPGYYRDTKVPGLQLRVTANGAKTYYHRKRMPAGGDGPRNRIGKHKQVSLEAARKIAAEWNNQIAAGVDVAQLRRDAKDELTLQALFASYFTDRTAHGKRSVDAMRQTVESWLTALPDQPPKKHGRKRVKPVGSVDWSSRRLSEITREKVGALHKRIMAAGKGTTANRVAELISAAWEYGKREGLHALENPAADIQAAPERERSRFLKADELPRFITRLESTPQPWRDYFTVLLFVGFRRNATAAMRWQDVDLQNGTWTVPRAQIQERRRAHAATDWPRTIGAEAPAQGARKKFMRVFCLAATLKVTLAGRSAHGPICSGTQRSGPARSRSTPQPGQLAGYERPQPAGDWPRIRPQGST